MVVKECYTPLSMDRSTRQNISMEARSLNEMLKELGLVKFKRLHPKNISKHSYREPRASFMEHSLVQITTNI